MDLSRQEYPKLLQGLQPSQAVALVNQRVEYIGQLNNGIAEWLEERRRVEEAYASGLRKLSRKKLHEESMGLGAFTSAWQRIVSSTEEVAASHHALAQGIERDVVTPLRGFSSTNREMQSLSTSQGNLSSMARGAERASGRGHNNSAGDWDSQAPFIMEQLQAADESRCNHLRDVLTQLQTHEVDQVERNRKTAEQCLNALLTVETADEIKLFAVRNARDPGARSSIAEGASSPAPTPATARTPQRNTRMPPRVDTNSSLNVPRAGGATFDDASSQRSASVHEEEKKKSRLGGFKRIGTVFSKNKRNSIMPGSKSTPTKNREEAVQTPTQAFSPSPAIRENDMRDNASTVSTPTREAIKNLDSAAPPRDEDVISPVPTNGTRTTQPEGLQAPLQPQIPQDQQQTQFSQMLPPQQTEHSQQQSYEAPPGPPPPPKTASTDSDGYSAPSSRFDPISEIEQDAASYGGASSRQYDVDIRNAPIAEEDTEASAVTASLANTLRAQAQAGPQRRTTTRGRRDVRNTMFVPSPASPTGDAFAEQPPLPSIPQQQQSSMPSTSSSSNLIMTPFIASMANGQAPAAAPHRAFPGIERQESDTQSIRSARSTGPGDPLSKHTAMHQQGLNVSMVETVSAWFEQGTVSKVVVIGEMALAHNSGSFPSTSSAESIRIDNFGALEKVAPNPAFISQRGGQSGEYSVDISSLSRGPQIGFKYQVHVDPSSHATHAPIALTPAWRIEPAHSSVILSYSLNPALATTLSSPLRLSNVVFVISLDTSNPSAGRASAASSKPGGDFNRQRGTITIKVGDVSLSPGAAPEKVLVRFTTPEGTGKQGRVEAKWEVNSAPDGLGSGLGVSMLESGASAASAADPFADEDANMGGSGEASWRRVQGARKLVSGTYQAL